MNHPKLIPMKPVFQILFSLFLSLLSVLFGQPVSSVICLIFCIVLFVRSTNRGFGGSVVGLYLLCSVLLSVMLIRNGAENLWAVDKDTSIKNRYPGWSKGNGFVSLGAGLAHVVVWWIAGEIGKAMREEGNEGKVVLVFEADDVNDKWQMVTMLVLWVVEWVGILFGSVGGNIVLVLIEMVVCLPCLIVIVVHICHKKYESNSKNNMLIAFTKKEQWELSRQIKTTIVDTACPISMKVMIDPVICEDGHTYDRKSIERWFETKLTSPITGAKLQSKKLYPNLALRKVITNFDSANNFLSSKLKFPKAESYNIESERRLFMATVQRLQKGEYFLKHETWGSVHTCWVGLTTSASPSFHHRSSSVSALSITEQNLVQIATQVLVARELFIEWRIDSSGISNGRIPISEICSVTPGQILNNYEWKSGKSDRAPFSFSIVAVDHILDLKTDSLNIRNQWISDLMTLLEIQKYQNNPNT